MKANRCWTVMVYMAGDNGKVFEGLHGNQQLMAPMEEQGYKDIEKMEAIGSSENVAVLVQFDTLSDREHTYRIYIRPANEERIIENIPEQNTGDPSSLRDFIVWGINHYPAQNYAVILWNHGTGWKEDDIYAFARNRGTEINIDNDEVRSLTRSPNFSSTFFLSSVIEVLDLDDNESRAIAFDDSSLDFLDNAKLQQAFREAEEQTGQKVSVIGMDACLMSMVEVAYQLRANADYMVGSQEVEPLSGWPYTDILHNLKINPTMSSEELSKLIVKEYGRFYEEESWQSRGRTYEVTQSAINLEVMDNLSNCIGQLALVLRQLLNEQDLHAEIALSRIQRHVLRFRDKDFVDLHNCLEILQGEYAGDNSELQTILDKTLRLMDLEASAKPIIANVTLGRRLEPAQGLSIYLPAQGYSRFYERSDFSKCGWGDFIQLYNAS